MILRLTLAGKSTQGQSAKPFKTAKFAIQTQKSVIHVKMGFSCLRTKPNALLVTKAVALVLGLRLACVWIATLGAGFVLENAIIIVQ